MKQLILIVILALSTTTFALDTGNLRKGFTRADNVKPFTKIKNLFGYRPAFLLPKDDTGALYFSLSKNGQVLAYYDFSSNVEPTAWPLTRWPHLYYPEELYSRHLMKWTDEARIGAPHYTHQFNSVGCLSNTPLRYGALHEGGG